VPTYRIIYVCLSSANSTLSTLISLLQYHNSVNTTYRPNQLLLLTRQQLPIKK